MRQKRQKPEHGRFGRRRYKEFGRQIDADLTEDPPREDNSEALSGSKLSESEFSSDEFEGAELPSIERQEAPSSADPPPAITLPVVREKAMRLLVNREHGRNELEQKLLQRELPQDLIVSVLDQLAQEGLQCDSRFAESYTRMRVDRGYGANKIRADLQARRLEQSVIEEAISDSGADWAGVAAAALGRKFSSIVAPDIKTRAKMQRFLYQRGFAAEEIRSAMNNYKE